ncbi:MAG TPA: SIMPL domain-containing protein [Micromonosporaceae bacterium]
MTDGPVVLVRGESLQEVPPEIARFGVTVMARERDRQTTLARLTERAAAVRALIDGYGDVIERRETGALNVWPDYKKPGMKVVAYQGTVSTTVTVVDFTLVGELMLRLADHDQTTVAGPWWQIRPDSPVHREARRAAISAAIARAREYAEAVGARVTGLLEINDVGTGPQPIMAMAASFRGRGGEEAGPQLDLDPQVQTVHASVEARFAISEPTVLAEPAG